MGVTRTFGMPTAGGALVLTLALTLGNPPGVAAQGREAGWLPWLGCWELVGEEAEGPMLCVRPLEAPGAVEMLTVATGEIVARDTIVADGVERAVSREGCDGRERWSFSGDGRRIFLRSDYVCEGGVERRATGVVAMASPGEWVDAEAIEVDGEPVTWVRRYRLAPPERAAAVGLGGIAAERGMSVRVARRAAAAGATLEDVAEASRIVHPRAVEAWIAEVGRPFEVTAERLLELADAGVPEEVIDVVVAVSFPDRFAVNAQRAPERLTPTGKMGMGRRTFPMWGLYGAWAWDPYYAYYSPYSYWGAWGARGGWYGGYYWGPTTIVVDRRGEGPRHGRVVKGRGYRRGGTAPSGTTSTPSVSRGRSSGSSVSSGRTGRSSSGGRKAKRRGGG